LSGFGCDSSCGSGKAEVVTLESGRGRREGLPTSSCRHRALAAAVAVVVAFALATGCGSQSNGAVQEPATTQTSRAVSTSTAAATSSSERVSTSVSSTPPPTEITSTAHPRISSPPTASPYSTIPPAVTAGTAVPWSPTSPRSLVGDSGNPRYWPAARPKPPSLAGAYGNNLIRALVSLVTYQDWVWSHPDPRLVQNYMDPSGSAYASELRMVSRLKAMGWHSDPSPTEIDWVGVTLLPRPIRLVDGKLAHDGHWVAYLPGSLDAVFNQKRGEFLNQQGRVVAHSIGGGRKAFAFTLKEATNGRWRVLTMSSIGVRDLPK
jgi:hypothetical protein